MFTDSLQPMLKFVLNIGATFGLVFMAAICAGRRSLMRFPTAARR